MADRLKVSQVSAQVFYRDIPKLKVSQVSMQVFYVSTETTPTQEQLMRHGCWFGDGVKKPFWWAK